MITALLSGAALAEDGDPARSGFYLGIEGLGVHSPGLERDIESRRDFGEIDIQPTGAFVTYFGYRIVPRVAVEVEYDYVGKQKVDENRTKLRDLEALSGTVNGKFFALTGRVEPYVLGGLGANLVEERSRVTNARTSETDLVVRVGAGTDVHVTDVFAVTFGIDYVIGTGELAHYDWLTYGGGIQFHF